MVLVVLVIDGFPLLRLFVVALFLISFGRSFVSELIHR